MILFFAFSWAVRELPPQLPTGWRRKKRPTASDKELRKMTVWNPSRVVIPSQKAVKIPFRRFACKVAEIKVAFLNVSVDLFMTRKPCPNRKRMIYPSLRVPRFSTPPLQESANIVHQLPSTLFFLRRRATPPFQPPSGFSNGAHTCARQYALLLACLSTPGRLESSRSASVHRSSTSASRKASGTVSFRVRPRGTHTRAQTIEGVPSASSRSYRSSER